MNYAVLLCLGLDVGEFCLSWCVFCFVLVCRPVWTCGLNGVCICYFGLLEFGCCTGLTLVRFVFDWLPVRGLWFCDC